MAREGKDMVESIPDRVPVPMKSSLASSSSARPSRRSCCDRGMDFSVRSMLENHVNFKNSAAPARFMYFNHDGSWLDFSSEVLSSLRSAFLEEKPMFDVSIGGSRYLFDFMRMLQIDFESGFQRSIAWIDENEKCFFPKTFLGEDFEDNLEKSWNRKIEMSIRMDQNPIKKKKEKVDKEEADASSFKKQEEGGLKRPCLSLPGVKSSRWPSTRLVREGEKAYAMVRDYFLPGIRKVDPSAIITAVHQCTFEGHFEKARYDDFQKQIEIIEASRGTSNTVYVWHGVSSKGVDSILLHGFGIHRMVFGPESYGLGVYVSPVGLPHVSAELSAVDENGEKHVILCRVILGNVEKLEAGSQQYLSSSVDFDTGADDPNNPKWYVIWSTNMNKHIIPEYVVSFKSFNHVQGQIRGSTGIKYSMVKLISKMKSLLPPAKLREVVNLYDTYRDGTLAKDHFITHLQLIAGDELLLSTIRDICGSE